MYCHTVEVLFFCFLFKNGIYFFDKYLTIEKILSQEQWNYIL